MFRLNNVEFKIDDTEANAKRIQDLNEMESFVNRLEETDERENTMYLFEHKPF